MTTSNWRRSVQCLIGLAVLAAILAPAPAHAQITRVSNTEWNQAIGFKLGYFALKGDDSRGEDDVIFRNQDSLLFRTSDFNGATISGEWLVALGPWLEAGAEVGFYQRTVPSIYRNLQRDDGTEIAQDLKLRIVPMMATVRFLPIGRTGVVQPYVGAGIGAFNWRYSETGEFVDTNSNTFRAAFVANGTDVGAVVLGGVRFAVGDVWLVGGELRYQDVKGDTGGFDQGFLADRINLGGWTTSFGIHFRF